MLYSCCHCVCHSVKCCRMLYSHSCCTVNAILYASVLCCHVPYSCPCCTVAATVYSTVLCVAACRVVASCCTVHAIVYAVQLPMLYSCCHCVFHSVMCCRMPCSCFMLYSSCHCVCRCSVLPRSVQLLPLCMPQC